MNKKVLFVTSSLDTGGAQRAMSNLLTHLPDSWNVDILINSEDGVLYPYKGTLFHLGIREPKSRTSIWYQLHVFLKRIYRLRRMKEKNDYDLCISFLDSANVANILSGKQKCRVVVSVRIQLSGDKTFIYRHLVAPMVKLLYNKTDKVVAVSKTVEMDLNKNFDIEQEKLITIYNGYDLEKIAEESKKEIQAGEERWFGADNFIFCTFGRYEAQKAQWHLVRAFREITEKHPNAKLLMFGRGAMKEYLVTLVKELQMEDNIRVEDFIPNPYAVMKRCNAFVLPSTYEGLSNALIEAMACGLPCISTETGAREIFAPGTNPIEDCVKDKIDKAEFGILTPIPSGIQHNAWENLETAEVLMAEAMAELLDNKELYMNYKKQAKKRSESFSIENSVKAWLAIMEEC